MLEKPRLIANGSDTKPDKILGVLAYTCYSNAALKDILELMCKMQIAACNQLGSYLSHEDGQKTHHGSLAQDYQSVLGHNSKHPVENEWPETVSGLRSVMNHQRQVESSRILPNIS